MSERERVREKEREKEEKQSSFLLFNLSSTITGLLGRFVSAIYRSDFGQYLVAFIAPSLDRS